MAQKTRKAAFRETAPAAESLPARRFWKPWWLLICALVPALIVFGPALQGTFLFDDFHLPFADPNAGQMGALTWIGGVRPVLMLTYWANYAMSGANPFWYHVTNVVIHAGTAVLVLFILERLFSIAGATRDPRACALAGAAIFLFHPLQTESVAYIAGRSEVVSGFLFCAAWLVYLNAFESETSVMTSLKILVLGGAAVLAKENAICLPAILFATDVFWAKRPFRSQMARRVKPYVPFGIGGAIASVWILRSLGAGTGAGLTSGASPAQYALTQCRAILTYVRLFFVPVGQNGDWQLPFFRSLTQGGAWIYALGLLTLIAGIVRFSSRFRLICFGLALFLLMLAPTSSVVPIKDALAERRMYMPIIGLIFASVSGLIALADRFSVRTESLRIAAVAAAVIAAALSWQRSAVWIGPVAFWSDSALKNPSNSRAHFGLGSALVAARNCNPAIREFTLARSQDPSNDQAIWNLGEALECDGQLERALAVWQDFANSKPSAETWNQVAYTNARLGRTDAAFSAIDKALSLDPNNATSYAYRGLARLTLDNLDGARADLAHALELDPNNAVAVDANRRLGAAGGR
jgi:Flp pilus assembly protein TadD